MCEINLVAKRSSAGGAFHIKHSFVLFVTIELGTYPNLETLRKKYRCHDLEGYHEEDSDHIS